MARSPKARRRDIVVTAPPDRRGRVPGVGVNEVWSSAVVAKSTLYQQFRSTDELVGAAGFELESSDPTSRLGCVA